MSHEDITHIRLTKLCRTLTADRPCWAYTKSGMYSVKTGYDLAMQIKEDIVQQQALEPRITLLKAKIWSLKPQKA